MNSENDNKFVNVEIIASADVSEDVKMCQLSLGCSDGESC